MVKSRPFLGGMKTMSLCAILCAAFASPALANDPIYWQRGVAPREAFNGLFGTPTPRDCRGNFAYSDSTRAQAPAFKICNFDENSMMDALKLRMIHFYGTQGGARQLVNECQGMELSGNLTPHLAFPFGHPQYLNTPLQRQYATMPYGYTLTYRSDAISPDPYIPSPENPLGPLSPHVNLLKPNAEPWGISPLPSQDLERTQLYYEEGAASVFGPAHPLVKNRSLFRSPKPGCPEPQPPCPSPGEGCGGKAIPALQDQARPANRLGGGLPSRAKIIARAGRGIAGAGAVAGAGILDHYANEWARQAATDPNQAGDYWHRLGENLNYQDEQRAAWQAQLEASENSSWWDTFSALGGLSLDSPYIP